MKCKHTAVSATAYTCGTCGAWFTVCLVCRNGCPVCTQATEIKTTIALSAGDMQAIHTICDGHPFRELVYNPVKGWSLRYTHPTDDPRFYSSITECIDQEVRCWKCMERIGMDQVMKKESVCAACAKKRGLA